MPPSLVLSNNSDFPYAAIGQYIHHNLCAEFECVAEGFTVCQHLALRGHIGFKLFLLFFSQGANQVIPRLNDIIERLGILAVLLSLG
jgi:hypothetical protein